MGGRGSGGSRSGGGSASANTPRLVSPNQYYQEKYRDLTDKELNRALINSRNLMNKENAKVRFEEAQLEKVLKDFKNVSMSDADYEAKSAALDKQMSKVNEARSRASVRETAYYLAINEKNNVRAKQTVADLNQMTNGQLNSYYNRMYASGAKARTKAERTNNPKTRAKYTKLYEEHYQNFFKANAEKEKRSLWGRDW